jgi:hypothetical protein
MKKVVEEYFGMHDVYPKVELGIWSLISKEPFRWQGFQTNLIYSLNSILSIMETRIQ